MRVTVNSYKTLESCISQIRDLYHENGKGRYMEIEIFTGKKRTSQQNRALHLWLGMLADTLNAAGLDMRQTLNPEIELPWSAERCKEFLWRPVQQALTGKKSTKDAGTMDYYGVQEVLVRHLQENFGITCPPWPNEKRGYD